MAWVYILECRDGTYYVGSTRNLDARLDEHQRGLGSAYTRRRLPVRLAWAEEFSNVGEAFAMEKRLQGWSHAKREAVVEGRWEDLPALSKSRRAAHRVDPDRSTTPPVEPSDATRLDKLDDW